MDRGGKMYIWNDVTTPSANDIEWLAKRAGKLFIYAPTTVRYISPESVLGTKQHSDLKKLYASILSGAADPERLEEQEMIDILLTLRTVICAKEPITVETLASLLSLTEERVRLSLGPLRSILPVQDSTHGLVSPFSCIFR